MTIEVAINRALYRHLDRIQQTCIRHYNRSGRPGYWNRAESAARQMNDLFDSCRFIGLALV